MELTLDVASAVCPHCGAVNLFPGFSRIERLSVGIPGECERDSAMNPNANPG
jgi:hypothetical protein